MEDEALRGKPIPTCSSTGGRQHLRTLADSSVETVKLTLTSVWNWLRNKGPWKEQQSQKLLQSNGSQDREAE